MSYVTHSLWTFMLQAFGIHWVMPRSMVGLLSCWHQWLGKHYSDIWNLVPRCLMWIVRLEWNRRSFEDKEKTLDELKVLCHHSLLEWSRCWSFMDCSSLSEFLSSLILVSWLPSVCCAVCFFYFLLFIIMNLFFHFSLIYNSFVITYQKKKESSWSYLWDSLIVKDKPWSQFHPHLNLCSPINSSFYPLLTWESMLR